VCAPGDDDENRLRKVLFSVTAVLMVPAGLLWSALYFAYHERVAALIPFVYSSLTLLDLVILVRFRRFELFRQIQQALIFALPVAFHLALGGFVGSSAVILWSLIAVVMALLFGSGREPIFWFAAFVSAVVAASLLQPQLTIDNALPRELVLTFFVLNVVTVSSIAFLALHSFMTDRRRLRELEISYLNQELMLRQSEKLATLGTLSAGVAHELNNPASAASRGVAQLRPLVQDLRAAYLELRASSSPAHADAMRRADERVRARVGPVEPLTPLERSDREEEIDEWLRALGSEDGGGAAVASLVDQGYTRAELEDVTREIPPSSIPAFVSWAARVAGTEALLKEIGEGVGRISQIVGAVRSYSYLDRGALQDVDVVEGLESTLVLLGSRLKQGIVVHREYESGLPRLQASGGELNQVWTNLIQNAADAMEGRGTLTLRARREAEEVVVEIEDDGPGIPPEAAPRVFDPFFTTKPPGQGTGLGLAITHNIVVQKHRGRIAVDSKPGRTTFRVFLPLGGVNGGSAGSSSS
jgi:signal transduction histidine kinase